MNLPSFSIVVPTYQRRELVLQALAALGRLTYAGAFEIIIVVDGSTDGTDTALRAVACGRPFKIIVQENRGLAAARNRGAVDATGEILLFLDDDMIAAPDLLQEHASSHGQGAQVVMGDIPLAPSSPAGILSYGVDQWAQLRRRRLMHGEPTLFDMVCGHLSVRRTLFESVGGFDERFTDGGTFGDEDLDLAVRLEGRCKISFNPNAVACQHYAVTPRQYLRQWNQAGRADVMFARKHPDRASELFKLHGRERPLTRFLLRPLAALTPVPAAVATAATWLGERTSGPPLLRQLTARLFRIARDLVYWAAVRRAGGIPESSEVLVLCYHAVTNLAGDPVLSQYGIDPGTFSAQMDDLRRRGFSFISPDEFEALLNGRGRVPRKAVLLTFDDCYEELGRVARDILQPRGIQAIAFAVSGMASGTNEWDQRIGARRLALLDAPGLRELGSHGTEIGCHSKSHRQLPTLSDDELIAETEGAADQLTEWGVPAARFFAYPHGANDPRSRAAARRAGFSAAFALIPCRASRRSDRFAVPRIEILARDAGWRFWVKTNWPRLAPLFNPDPPHARARRVAGRLYRRITASADPIRPSS